MRFRSEETPEDCGCAPTEAEQRAFSSGITRRGALTVGAFGLIAAGALAAPFVPAAFAAGDRKSVV